MITGYIRVRRGLEIIEIIADEDKDTLACSNGKVIKNLASKFLAKLLSITSYWPSKLNGSTQTNQESYSIKIFFEDETREYIGKGKYPSNYTEFQKLIYEVTNYGLL